jgi:hypothetical protein
MYSVNKFKKNIKFDWGINTQLLGFISITLTLIWYLAIFYLSYIKQEVSPSVNNEHIYQFALAGNKYQIITTLLIFMALGISCLLISYKQSNKIACDMSNFDILVISIFICFSDNKSVVTNGMILGYAIVKIFNKINIRLDKYNINFIKYFLYIIATFYIFYFLILPFKLNTLVYSGSQLSWIDFHYAGTILPGYDLLAYGQSERSNYGYGMTILSFIGFYFLKFFSLDLYEFDKVLKIYNIFALFLVLLILKQLNKKYYALLTILILILIPNLSNLGPGIDTPNQGGIRFLPFLIGFYIYTREFFSPKFRIYKLIIISSILLVMSPELGIIFFIGISIHIFFNFLNADSYRERFKSIFYICIVPILSMMLHHFFSQYFYHSQSSSLLNFFKLFSGYFTGPISKPNILSGLLLFFSFLSILRVFHINSVRNVGKKDLFQASVALMMMGWIFYYLKSMTYSNIWFEIILFTFFLSPNLKLGAIKLINNSKKFSGFYGMLVVVLFTGMLFYASEQYSIIFNKYRTELVSKCNDNKDGNQILRNVCFTQNSNDGYYIRRYIEYSNTIVDKKNSIVFSNYPYTMRLRGYNKGLPWYEPFAEAILNADVISQAKWLDDVGPKYLYLDNPDSRIGLELKLRMSQIKRMIEMTLRYKRIEGGNEYFIIYKRQ